MKLGSSITVWLNRSLSILFRDAACHRPILALWVASVVVVPSDWASQALAYAFQDALLFNVC